MKLNTNLLADIFQSNMILPLNKDFKLGGVVENKQKVEVAFNHQNYQTTADEDGNWQVTIPAVSDPNFVGNVLVKAGEKK